MMVFDNSMTEQSSHARSLYEQAQLNIGDEHYAESREGKLERVYLLVGKIGTIPWGEALVPVRLSRLKLDGFFFRVRVTCCDYSSILTIPMTAEVAIDTFQQSVD